MPVYRRAASHPYDKTSALDTSSSGKSLLARNQYLFSQPCRSSKVQPSFLSPGLLQRGKMKGRVEEKVLLPGHKESEILSPEVNMKSRECRAPSAAISPVSSCHRPLPTRTHRSSSTACQPVHIPIPPRTHSYSQDHLHSFSSTNINWIVSKKWAPRQSRATPAKPDKIVSSNGWGPP